MKDASSISERPYADDEIDLGHLVRSLWRGRGLIIATILVSVMLVAAYLVIDLLRKTSIRYVESFVALNGIVDQSYPNGASFSPNDLLSEEVLAELIRQFDIRDRSPEQMRRGLSVQYGHPDTAQIRLEWDRVIQDAIKQNASPSEISALNDRYSDRIKRLNESSLSIQVFPSKLGLDEGNSLAIAQAIPRAWQTVFVDVYRFTTPPEIIPISGLSPPRELSTTRNLLQAQQFLFAIRRIAATVSENPRLSTLRAGAGPNAAEIQFQIDRFNNFYLNPMLSGSIESGDNFVGSRLQQLIRERSRLLALQRATTANIDQMANLRGRASPAAAPSSGVGDRSGTVLSLDESGLSSVIDLAQQAQLNQYVILLFEREWGITEQLAEINFQIDQLTSEYTGSVDVGGEAEEAFALLSQQVEALFARLMEEETRLAGQLYVTQVAPQVYSASEGFSQRAGLLLALAMLLGTLAGIAATLVRKSILQT